VRIRLWRRSDVIRLCVRTPVLYARTRGARLSATKVLPSGSEDPANGRKPDRENQNARMTKKNEGDQMSGRGTGNSGPAAETEHNVRRAPRYNNR